MSITEFFVDKFNHFHHFETFQEYFAKIGVISYIIPDMHHTDMGLVWRGIIEYQDKYGEWLNDDCGSYQSIHECRTALMKLVIDHCLTNKINMI